MTAARRYGQVIRLRPECIADYERHHAGVWPEVLATIRACNIRNYSIFRWDDVLFASFDYVGDDYEADMARMAADPKTQEWWALMEPMQEPVAGRADGDWWLTLREVFHTD